MCRYLPPHFPQDKPVLKVVPPVSHAWVDDSVIVTGCYSLNTVSSGVFCREIVYSSILHLLHSVQFGVGWQCFFCLWSITCKIYCHRVLVCYMKNGDTSILSNHDLETNPLKSLIMIYKSLMPQYARLIE